MAEGSYIGLRRSVAERIEEASQFRQNCGLAVGLDYTYCWVCGFYDDNRMAPRKAPCLHERDPIRGGLLT